MKLALVLLALAACPAPSTPPRPVSDGPETQPRLVVLLVIDQWPEWSFEQKRPELRGGFARLLADGEWHVGRHPSAATLTAAGHALLGSGQPPARSGILANQWWNRDLARMIHAAEDEDGHVSAKWLRVPGLGDSIESAHTGAKAVAVSLKDRAAILPLGHHGLSIFYDPKYLAWTSTGNDKVHGYRAWLQRFERVRAREWRTPLDRVPELARVPDDQVGEVGEKGLSRTFPHELNGIKYNELIFALPQGNDIVLDMALAAIDNEQLGKDRTPDLLVISLSAHDYIAHGWGHESWEMWDCELRLDQKLDEFLGALDTKVGTGRWAMIVTSDHGGAPLPELAGGGRYTDEQLRKAANLAASAVLGTGEWVATAHYPTLYMTKAALAQNPKELRNAMKKIVFALRAFPGLERVDFVENVVGNCDQRTGDDRALCLTFDRERSGEIFFMLADGWIMEEEDERFATAHGSLHDYDRNVPVIYLPFGRTRHAPQAAPLAPEIDMALIAPTIARWLGVPSPTSREASAVAAP